MNGKKRIVIASALLCAAARLFAATAGGVFLQDGGWLWTEQKDGTMKAAVQMQAGAVLEVSLSGTTDGAGNAEARTKEAPYDGSKGKTLKFAEVRYDGKTYWAISNRFVTGKTPAVLVEDCAMYNTPSLADVRNAHLDTGSVVAVGGTQTVIGGVDLTELSYYSTSAYAVRTVYVKAGKVSTALDDITAFKILDSVAKASTPEKKDALLDSAEALNLSASVRIAVNAAREEASTGGNLLAAGTASFSSREGALLISTLDGSKVNVRDVPGSQGGGSVLAQLENGTTVQSDTYTVKHETIEGITESWFHLTAPVEGWIFGGFTFPVYTD